MTEQREAIVTGVRKGERVLVIQRGPLARRPGCWAPLSGKAVSKVWESQTEDGMFRLHWWLAEAEEGEVVMQEGEVIDVRWVTAQEFARLHPVLAADRVVLRCLPAGAGTSVVEEPEPGAGEGDLMLAAGVLDLARTDRSAWLGDVVDAMPVGMVDVVAERQCAVRHERDVSQSSQPLPALVVSQLGCRCGECVRQPNVLVRGEVALDEADLPVDPVLAPDVRLEGECADRRVAS